MEPWIDIVFAATTFRSGCPKTNDTWFSCPRLSLDSSALPVSILCGDPKFPPIQHAGAIPPGSLSVPAQEHFGFHALRVVPVGECVFAHCRKTRVIPRRFAAPDPGVLAASEA